MEQERYFRLMEETSDITDKIILDTIKHSCAGPIGELVIDLPKRRADNDSPKIRPAVFRFTYELALGGNWRRFENTAAAVEMLNLSTYVLNNVLDDKGGLKNKKRRDNESIASHILRELAGELVRQDASKLTFDQYLKLEEILSQNNRFVTGNGQYVDGNLLREIDKDYEGIYRVRCALLTGESMASAARLGAIASGLDFSDGEFRALSLYGNAYGTIVQMVNDAGDFVPLQEGEGLTVSKVYQDQYSDLRHGCITLPAYVVLTEGTEEEKEAVNRVRGNLEPSMEDCLAVTGAFVKLGGPSRVREMTIPLAELAREQLYRFPESEARDFLENTLEMARWNKYFDYLERKKRRL
ncbi:MAG: polyprenyl synthetase family protein [archaeon]